MLELWNLRGGLSHTGAFAVARGRIAATAFAEVDTADIRRTVFGVPAVTVRGQATVIALAIPSTTAAAVDSSGRPVVDQFLAAPELDIIGTVHTSRVVGTASRSTGFTAAIRIVDAGFSPHCIIGNRGTAVVEVQFR